MSVNCMMKHMKTGVLACVLAMVLVSAGCTGTSPSSGQSGDSAGTTADGVSLNESVRDRLLEMESTHVRKKLEHKNYSSYGTGGMGSASVRKLSENSSGVYVEVTVPYSVTYMDEPVRSNETETVTPVEVTADQEASSIYLVTETEIKRVED